MRPYYQDDLVTLYHCDVLENLDLLGGGDVLVTDPPYGVAYQSCNRRQGKSKKIVGDKNTDARDRVLAEWGSKPAIVFGRWDKPRPTNTRHRLIWDKSIGAGMGDLTLPWGRGEEEIYVLGTGFTGKRESNVIRVAGYVSSANDRPNHPTPKPVPLMELLITKCPPGVIVDPFAGSGATLRAAKNLGRRAIGMEIEEEYCEIIAGRMGQDCLPLIL